MEVVDVKGLFFKKKLKKKAIFGSFFSLNEMHEIRSPAKKALADNVQEKSLKKGRIIQICWKEKGNS